MADGRARQVGKFACWTREAGSSPRRGVESLFARKACKLFGRDATTVQAEGYIEAVLAILDEAILLTICSGRSDTRAAEWWSLEITTQDATRIVGAIQRVLLNAVLVADLIAERTRWTNVAAAIACRTCTAEIQP